MTLNYRLSMATSSFDSDISSPLHIIMKAAIVLAGLYASFSKGQGHQGSFSLVKGTHPSDVEIFNFYWSISRAPRQ